MKCLVSAHGLFPEVDHSSPHTPSFLLMGSMYVFPWWLSERMGSAFVTILVKNNLLEWHIWLVFCFFFLMCCFSSYSFFPFLCSVCMLSAWSLWFPLLYCICKTSWWEMEELFVLFVGYRVLTVAWIPFWVVSMYTYWLLVQTGFYQVCFKLS